jgi:hypothetical protein
VAELQAAVGDLLEHAGLLGLITQEVGRRGDTVAGFSDESVERGRETAGPVDRGQ